ncbi:MAG: hypothetical protein ABS70_01155 [Nitrospira sp. SCN 59-13]|nr:MAG: hypothetical protein ABS70_01155 [Nitrospira sp. SCN 59-13]
MKPVVQADRTGCGIAAVAAIAGVSYARAKAVAASSGIFAHDRSLWSETGPVQRLLLRFGLHAAQAPSSFRSWADLPDCALLAIKWHRQAHRACWHWVVFVRDREREYVLDSNASLRRQVRVDFGRMQPKWFLSVMRHSPGAVYAPARHRSG